MALVPIKTGIIWQNDGTAAITGFASATDLWFVPNSGGTSGTMTNTSAASHWFKIDATGCQKIILQWTAKITNLGSATTATSGQWVVVACGMAYDSGDPDFIPQMVAQAPDTVSANNANCAVTTHGILWGLPHETATVQNAAVSASTACVANLTQTIEGGFLQNDIGTDTIAVNDRHVFLCEIGSKPFPSSTGLNTGSVTTWSHESLRLNGINTVWLAASAKQTFATLTAANARIKGVLRWVGYGESSTAHHKGIYPG